VTLAIVARGAYAVYEGFGMGLNLKYYDLGAAVITILSGIAYLLFLGVSGRLGRWLDLCFSEVTKL